MPASVFTSTSTTAESFSASCAVHSGSTSGTEIGCARTSVIFISERELRLETGLARDAPEIGQCVFREEDAFRAIARIVPRFHLAGVEHFVRALRERDRLDL